MSKIPNTRPPAVRYRRTYTEAEVAKSWRHGYELGFDDAGGDRYAQGFIDGLDYGETKLRELRAAIEAIASSTPEEREAWSRVYGDGDAS